MALNNYNLYVILKILKILNFLKINFCGIKKLKKTYDKLKSHYSIIEMVIKKRLEVGLSQDALAKKIGTKQSAIARLESGKVNPTLLFLPV